MNATPRGGDRPLRDRPVPDPVRAARAQRIAFDRIAAACPDCLSDGPDGPPEALARRLAAHPRLRPRLLARLRGAVADLPAFADALAVRDAKAPDGTSPDLLAGLLFHIGSFGPALDRDLVARLEATFGASATTFALDHAAVSPLRSAELDLSEPGLADRVAAEGREILAVWWGLSFGPAARWLVAPPASDSIPLLSGEAVAAIATAVTSHVLAEAATMTSKETEPAA